MSRTGARPLAPMSYNVTSSSSSTTRCRRLVGQAVRSCLVFVCLGLVATMAPAAADGRRSDRAEASSTEAQAQILRLIDSTKPPSSLKASPPAVQAEGLMPCADVGWSVYCVGIGWLDDLPDYSRLVANTSRSASFDGDVTYVAMMKQAFQLSDDQYLLKVRAELADAAAGVDKMLRLHDLLDSAAIASRRKDPAEYAMIMGGHSTTQNADNWCGPATFQMMEWARSGTKESQAHWRVPLGTGPAGGSGTAITSMVSLTNSATTWDNVVGAYQTVSVTNWGPTQFWDVHTAQLAAGAPVIEHPKLLTAYFSHISFNAGGHFQVGRGISKAADSSTRYVHIFEPWNEADWYVGGVSSGGAQSVTVSKLLDATKANTNFKNIGL